MIETLIKAERAVQEAREIVNRERELGLLPDHILEVVSTLLKHTRIMTEYLGRELSDKRRLEKLEKETTTWWSKEEIEQLKKENAQLREAVEESNKILDEINIVSLENKKLKKKLEKIENSWNDFCQREDVICHINNPHLGAAHTCVICKLWSEINRINNAIRKK